jgi:hypothetical protein
MNKLSDAALKLRDAQIDIADAILNTPKEQNCDELVAINELIQEVRERLFRAR